MKLDEMYKKDAFKLAKATDTYGKVAWRSPSNIALVKYWGKHGTQLPQNPSLSFVLEKSYTETTLEYKYVKNRGSEGTKITFTFDGKPNVVFGSRVNEYLNKASEYLPFIPDFEFVINSFNSFPHSSGIASSASSMSSLALCLISMERQIFGSSEDEASFRKKASFISRLGSGSAARSVYDGFTVWGKHDAIHGSDDEVAMRLDMPVASGFGDLRDAILITYSGAKKVSSSEGHRLMNNHPFAEARFQQAKTNLEKMVEAIRNGNDPEFIALTESEALSLHAMMMTSSPGFTLLNQNTWKIIESIRKFRQENHVFITFTLDAGPNVHVIYRGSQELKIKSFIKEELLKYCENGQWLDDKAGNGPEQLL